MRRRSLRVSSGRARASAGVAQPRWPGPATPPDPRERGPVRDTRHCALPHPARRWRSPLPGGRWLSRSAPFLALPRPRPASAPKWPLLSQAHGPRRPPPHSRAVTTGPQPDPSIVVRIVPLSFHLAPRLTINGGSSGPRELPPQALTEPYVTLSRHTALPARGSLRYRNSQCTKSRGEPARTCLSQAQDRRLCPRIRLYFRQAQRPSRRSRRTRNRSNGKG